jgi:5-deoxy-glucuronate isomerase
LSSVAYPLTEDACVRRATNRQKGRTRSLAPGSAAVRHLHYGRIVVDSGDAPVRYSTDGLETALICLNGSGEIVAGGQRFSLTQYDAVYAPPRTEIEVRGISTAFDLAEIAAPVEGKYPIQFVSFAEVRTTPALHFKTGGASTTRDLNIVIGKNVQAGRILAGVTFTEPGHWASWPPHEHGATLEEAYVYIAMPAPAWGIQLVYTDPREPELAVVVREGDCVVMPAGYHPNVSAPGASMGFLWIMAAHREVTDREFGLVNVQPEYAQAGSGLEAARGSK